ncbi:GumC family protein [Janthinobacterium sp. P210006]|uniref:GumC family protein n=1 Tax=Janthinobacterium sp. P210006 TaxID=3112939 RepID=UPI002E276FC0|nr:Wzz/FepE/Etk N-terminal domain-containing protein [Janthinobacterium sp. P210006]
MSEHVEIQNKQHSVNKAEEDGIHLLDVCAALVRQRRIIIILPLITGALALTASLLMTPKYVSTAVIMPPQQQSSSVSSMLGQLGGLAGGVGGIAGLKNPNDLYVGMLQSRTIADNLIERYKLKERFKKNTMDETREKLTKIRALSNGKDGLIGISIEDKDPKFAAELANAHVTELAALTKGLAITEASRRRAFFEKQLTAAKDDLANAEVAMRKMQESTGMLQLEGQVKGIIANEAQLQGTIAAKNVQLQSMRSFATINNPEYMRLQEEVRGLQNQLEKQQNGKGRTGDVMIPSGKIPEASIEYVRTLRDVKYYETIFELLAKQYELAKIDEAKDSSMIQQLDLAVPAEEKTKPKPLALTVVAFIGGGVLAILIALLRDTYISSRKSEKNIQRWLVLRNAWKK